MDFRDKIKEKLHLDFNNSDYVRNAVISVLQMHNQLFFDSYIARLSIEGKINENGVIAVFEITSDEIAHEKIDIPVEKKTLTSDLKNKIQEKLVQFRERLGEAKSLTEITISFGISIPMVAKNVVTLTLTKLD